jgi:RimJ/RimL family protein N-acetyltransferase
MNKVKKFMLLPEVYRYCAEFGVDKENAKFESGSKEIWLSFNIYGQEVGIINVHVMSGSMCMFHPYILRDYRHYYDEMVQDFFDWFVDTMPENALKLNAMIPTLFKGAIKAANKAGMKQEGIDRLSYRHESGVYDRLLFGITREEIKNGQTCK